MKAKDLHPWRVSPAEAQRLQRQLAGQIVRRGEETPIRLVAGADISAGDQRGRARGAVVVLSYPELTLAEVSVIEQELSFPYVPGLLSFREAPLIISAFEQLSLFPDLLLVDGQGLAHPRRFGLACHLGLLLDLPSIGCAKSILCGAHGPLGPEAGATANLIHEGEVVGAAVSSKSTASPVYVSIGHRVDLPMSIQWVLRCCKGYRIPEPLRLAHLAAGGQLRLSAPVKTPGTLSSESNSETKQLSLL